MRAYSNGRESRLKHGKVGVRVPPRALEVNHMCYICEPTEEGYVYWPWAGSGGAFFYQAIPDRWTLEEIEFVWQLPMDFDIPYV